MSDAFCYFSNPALQECKKWPSFNGLNAGLAVHMLKLVNDSDETGKGNRSKKKEHPLGCSKVSGRRGKKTGDAYKRR